MALGSISEQDLRRMPDVVCPDVVASENPEMPVEVLRGLTKLIPCAGASFYVMDTHTCQVHAQQDFDLIELPAEDAETDAMLFQAYWDCVDCCAPELTSDHEQVTMWSDAYTEPEYSQLTRVPTLAKVMSPIQDDQSPHGLSPSTSWMGQSGSCRPTGANDHERSTCAALSRKTRAEATAKARSSGDLI